MAGLTLGSVSAVESLEAAAERGVEVRAILDLDDDSGLPEWPIRNLAVSAIEVSQRYNRIEVKLLNQKFRETQAFPMHGLAVDLFAGAGGASVGMKRAGYEPRLAVESDEAAAGTFLANHKGVKVLVGDIAQIDPARAARSAGLRRGDVTILNTCPPCQGFSSLYRGAGSAVRNDLVLQTIRWTSALLPRVVMLENVPGLARDHRFVRLVRGLRGLGYGARFWMIDAASIGVPQRRKRLILIAVRGISNGCLPTNLLAAMPVGWRRVLSAAYSIRGLAKLTAAQDPVHVHRSHSPAVEERIAAIPPNGSRFDLPVELQLECHKRVARRCATGPYGRVPTKGPAATMTTRCTTPSCGPFIHPTFQRGLTLREAATIQTFPRSYRFVGRYQQIESQVGNAIPPRLTERILKTLQRNVEQ